MKSEPKAFASLSSGLLARKGAARPAMRPQGFGQGGASLEDLGWNDMGFEPPKPAAVPIRDASHDSFGEEVGDAVRPAPTGLTPVESPVHNQQAQIAGRFAALVPDDADEDEIDETAELYEPEAPDADEPEVELQAEPAVEPQPEPPVEAVVPAVRQPKARRMPTPRVATGGKAKSAFTLRLDPDRHLKLRLACAVNGQSAQMLVTEALDAFLASLPELEAMAKSAKSKG